MKDKNNIYWKTLLGIPIYKIDWYFKYWIYKISGFTFNKIADQKKYWNTRGKYYFDDFFNTDYYKYELFFQDMLIKELKQLKFCSIFEAGCGFGWNIKRLKKEFHDAKVEGVDFSLPQLQNNKLYEPDVITRPVQGNVLRMPFKDKSFDIGFTMGVYMNIHPDNIEKAVDELLRVTKKYIIHIEWDQNNTKPALRKKRIFKTNIVSHNYKKIYLERKREIMKFFTYKDVEAEFYKRFSSTQIKLWEGFEGPEKYILTVIKV